jgi:hypothetical protein
MPIPFSCPRCGKRYTVDSALAGRKGRCKDCGRSMTIPNVADDGDDTIATEGYDLSEPLPVAAGAEVGSVFVPAGIDPEVPRTARTRRPASASMERRSRREDHEATVGRYLGILIAAPTVLLAGLGLTALLVPNGTLIAACVLAGVGGLLILVGYFVGLWAAWREDLLYGFGYAVFPPYTAYYILTRFEDLWPWFVAMTVGVGLVTAGGLIAESKLKDRPEPAAARLEEGLELLSLT